MQRRCLDIRIKTALSVFVICMAGRAGAADCASAVLTVYAAASTTNAVTDIGAMFNSRYPERVAFSFASSSTLAKQIENGAPADIYISANLKWMDYLEQKRMIAADTRINLLSNRIVLIVPATARLNRIRIEPGFDLLSIIGDSRFSMGDPDHVPAGIYGRKALEHLGVWGTIEKRVARARDVRAALALVERGEAPVGLVYATDAAISSRVKVAGTFPESSHPPIVYPVAVVIGRKSTAADRFMELLQSPEAGNVFQKYGFSVR